MKGNDEYKEEVETKIQDKTNTQINEAKNTMTKLRHITPGKEQKYLQQSTLEQAQTIIKIRLNMIKTRKNYKQTGAETRCRKCNQHKETTEHILECHTGGKEKFQMETCDDVEWLQRVAEVYKQIDKNNRENDDKEDEDCSND